MKAINCAFVLGLVVQIASADSIVNVTESSWVLPESITAVSSFGTLQNQLLVPDAGTGYLNAVSASGAGSTNFATFGTPSSYFNGEGTGSVAGGLILTSGPLTGSYLGVGYNYTNPAAGTYSGAIFMVSPSGTSQVILQTPTGGGTFYTPVIAPSGFGSLGGSILVSQDTADAVQLLNIASSTSASISTFAQLSISPFGLLFAPTGFGSVGGDLLVSSYQTGAILAIGPNGSITTFANIPLSQGQLGLRQMAFAPTGFGNYGGDLFVSVGSSTVGSGTYGAVDVLDSAGNLVAVLSQGTVDDPFDPRGLYFASSTQLDISDADPGLVLAPPSAFTAVPEPGALGLGILGLGLCVAARPLRLRRRR